MHSNKLILSYCVLTIRLRLFIFGVSFCSFFVLGFFFFWWFVIVAVVVFGFCDQAETEEVLVCCCSCCRCHCFNIGELFRIGYAKWILRKETVDSSKMLSSLSNILRLPSVVAHL